MRESGAPRVLEGSPRGDFGRRLAARRAELGLTREETANRAGMSPRYLKYLEERPTAAPGMGVLLRLAGTLRTTVSELSGGNTELPPGLGMASRAPNFRELNEPECRALLRTHGVGRMAIPGASGPVIVPVNYSVIDGSIVFRTAPGATPAKASGRPVAFEVDRIDDAFSEGWSVMVRGRARTVTDPEEVRRLTEQAYSTPWVGGRRHLWLRIVPLHITGRRITV